MPNERTFSLQLQELEMENSKLMADMEALRKAISEPGQPGAGANKELHSKL